MSLSPLKPLSYSFITYDEYKAGVNLMNSTDKSVFESSYYKNPLELNDTELSSLWEDIKSAPVLNEQTIASLKCVIPSELVDHYDTIAKERSVTGKAYDLHSK